MNKPKLFDKDNYKIFVDNASQADNSKDVHAYFHYIYTTYGNSNINFIEELQSAIDNFKKENKQKKTICSKLEDGFNLFSEFINNKNTPASASTINITLKQKIYLLDKLGFFDLDKVKELTEAKKGKLVSLLLHTSQKNTTDTIRERYSFNEKNQKNSITELNSILSELGLEKL